MYEQDDKGINDYILGCSNEELRSFSKVIDALPENEIKLITEVLRYESRDRLYNCYEN